MQQPRKMKSGSMTRVRIAETKPAWSVTYPCRVRPGSSIVCSGTAAAARVEAEYKL